MKTETITITQTEKEIFYFLNDLRESGRTNMFGASPYIESKFGIDKYEARKILAKWMDNFNSDGYDNLTIIN